MARSEGKFPSRWERIPDACGCGACVPCLWHIGCRHPARLPVVYPPWTPTSTAGGRQLLHDHDCRRASCDCRNRERAEHRAERRLARRALRRGSRRRRGQAHGHVSRPRGGVRRHHRRGGRADTHDSLGGPALPRSNDRHANRDLKLRRAYARCGSGP